MPDTYQQLSNTFMLSSKFELFSKRLFSSICLIFTDLITLGCVGLVLLSNQSAGDGLDAAPPLALYLALACASVFYYYVRGHYQKRIPFWDEANELLKSGVFLAMLQGTLIAVLTEFSSVLIFVLAWPIATIAIIISRALTKTLLLRAKMWQLPTVIIGNGPNAIDTARALIEEKLLGYDIISFLSVDEKHNRTIDIDGKSYTVRCFGAQPEKFLRRLGSPHIVVALEKGGLNEIQSYFDRLTFWYPKISVVPALRGLPLFGTDIHHFFSHEVLILNFKNSLGRTTSRLAKRIFDLVFASIGILLLAPVFAVLAYKVRQTGKQVIFGHERVGYKGELFRCFKFRSMIENSQEVLDKLLSENPAAKEEWEREFKLKNDPRITRFGHIIRQTSLDELPQLLNVIKGDMSLVGPRPVTEEEILRYGDKASFYKKAKPGITGLWQVSGRNDIDYESRIDLDVWYVRNWSIWNDLVILIRTVSVVLNRSGAY